MATKKSSNPFLAMSAGCVAGGVEATAVWPMEFIKVRFVLFDWLFVWLCTQGSEISKKDLIMVSPKNVYCYLFHLFKNNIFLLHAKNLLNNRSATIQMSLNK